MARATSRSFPTETRSHAHYKTFNVTEFVICRGGETGPKREDGEKQLKRFHPSDHESISSTRY